MAIRIDNPRELGADRLVNAVAAHARLGGPCISVDFGTAVNYDVVSAEGEYLGGVIAPGVEISLDALTARGAKLPRIDLVAAARRRSARARSTRSARGSSSASPAQVDGIVARIRDELGHGRADDRDRRPRAPRSSRRRTTIDEVDDLLTLTGLRLLHEHNV